MQVSVGEYPCPALARQGWMASGTKRFEAKTGGWRRRRVLDMGGVCSTVYNFSLVIVIVGLIGSVRGNYLGEAI